MKLVPLVETLQFLMETQISLQHSTANTIQLICKCPLIERWGLWELKCGLSNPRWHREIPALSLRVLSLSVGIVGQCPLNTFYSVLLSSCEVEKQLPDHMRNTYYQAHGSSHQSCWRVSCVTWKLQCWACLLRDRPDSCFVFRESRLHLRPPMKELQPSINSHHFYLVRTDSI